MEAAPQRPERRCTNDGGTKHAAVMRGRRELLAFCNPRRRKRCNSGDLGFFFYLNKAYCLG